jgi:competence protein ComGC
MSRYINKGKKTTAAFTVVEMIVAATIMVTLTLAIVAGFTQNYSILQTNKVVNMLQNNARLATIKMTKDLRRTTLAQITIQKNTPLAGSDKLTYHLPSVDANSAPIVVNGILQWDANTVVIAIDATNPGNLVRTDANGTTVLTNNVNYITFRDINDIPQLYLSELKIGLGLQAASVGNRILNYNSTTVINMRN